MPASFPPPPYPPPPPPRAGWLAPTARTAGFTAVQLAVLRNQIVAFRGLVEAVVGGGGAGAGTVATLQPIPPPLLAACTPPDLPPLPAAANGGRAPPPPPGPAGVALLTSDGVTIVLVPGDGGGGGARSAAGPASHSGRSAANGGPPPPAWGALLAARPPTGPLYHAASDARTGPLRGGGSVGGGGGGGQQHHPPLPTATLPALPTPREDDDDGGDGHHDTHPAGTLATGLLAAHFPVAWERARARAEASADAAAAAAKAAGDAAGLRAALLLRRIARCARLQARLRAEAEADGAGLARMGPKAYLRAARDADEGLRSSARAASSRRAAALGLADWAARVKAWKAASGAASERVADARAARTRLALRVRGRLARAAGVPLGPGGKPRPTPAGAEADRAARMAALQANDWTKYQALLKASSARPGGAAGAAPGVGGGVSAGEKFAAIERFLAQTDEYLAKLTSRIASTKVDQAGRDARAAATVAAKAAGLPEAEVEAAAEAAAADASAAAAEAAAAVQATAATGASDADGGPGGAGGAMAAYLALASSSSNPVTGPPAGLVPPKGASLRPYQLVGLQWMVSLYDNHLNGILADEMGLGKVSRESGDRGTRRRERGALHTARLRVRFSPSHPQPLHHFPFSQQTVQVMALLAYLAEHRGDAGPHLIIVPNAVLVNWRAELAQWVPGLKCVYYVGRKVERAALYAAEVAGGRFHVLVTTFEFIMRDRSRLAKLDWRYIIIDEAQRMKDRESKLAKDLRHFTAARRLLLTGTPLQNELRELWSLLNLLLPEVFASRAEFAAWFVESLAGGSGPDTAGLDAEDAALAVERRVVVINRLHQILTPFMLRRQVADVEGKLPPKVALTVRCGMSPMQGAAYRWVVSTATLRVDPLGVPEGKAVREYAPLNNRAVELRKLANHPYLSYPAAGPADGSERTAADLVATCGKFAALDRILVKLRAGGHRVLLFSTMTRLLDLLEAYLATRWVPPPPPGWPKTIPGAQAPPVYNRAAPARMGWLRIDGNTTLEEREARIKAFNAPGSDAFVFLLSIRAAGRGLNLQTADTVIVYDPDPNPKNEEQAIARAHRIGQTKAVRVIHFEAVAGGGVDTADAMAAAVERGRDAAAAAPTSPCSPSIPPPSGQGGRAGGGYTPSVETFVRGTIQAAKQAMAAEVVDAGRFDTVTSNESRRATLEQMLAATADGGGGGGGGTAAAESAVGVSVSVTGGAAGLAILSHADLNAALARSPEELTMFNALDAECEWPDAGLPGGAIPPWLAFDDARLREVREHVQNPFAAPGTLGSTGAARIDGAVVLPPHLAPSGPRSARPKPGALALEGGDGWVDDEPGGEEHGRRGKQPRRGKKRPPPAGGGGGAATALATPRSRSATPTAGGPGETEDEGEEDDEEEPAGAGRRLPARRRRVGRSVDTSGTEEEHLDEDENVRWE